MHLCAPHVLQGIEVLDDEYMQTNHYNSKVAISIGGKIMVAAISMATPPTHFLCRAYLSGASKLMVAAKWNTMLTLSTKSSVSS